MLQNLTLQYLNCNVHPNEKLIWVNSQSFTPVCCLCEHEFNKDPNYPKNIHLKTLLDQILQINDEHLEKKNPYQAAILIDNFHIDSLKIVSDFKFWVNKQLDEVSTQINTYFGIIKQKFASFLKTKPNEQEIFEFLQTGACSIQSLQQQLDKLSSTYIINPQDMTVQLKQSVDQYVETATNQKTEVIKEIIQSRSQLEKSIQKVKDFLKEFNIEPLSIAKLKFSFSPTYKSSSITLTQNNMIAEQKNSESNGQRFVIADPQVNKKYKIQFGFKIIKISGWVGLGVCYKNILVTANYHFNYSSLGHGSYLISNNGYSWSHYKLDQNSQHKSFDFKAGDIVYVEVDYNNSQVKFKKGEAGQQHVLELDKNCKEALHPCANLCNPGDSVELLVANNIKFS